MGSSYQYMFQSKVELLGFKHYFNLINLYLDVSLRSFHIVSNNMFFAVVSIS